MCQYRCVRLVCLFLVCVYAHAHNWDVSVNWFHWLHSSWTTISINCTSFILHDFSMKKYRSNYCRVSLQEFHFKSRHIILNEWAIEDMQRFEIPKYTTDSPDLGILEQESQCTSHCGHLIFLNGKEMPRGLDLVHDFLPLALSQYIHTYTFIHTYIHAYIIQTYLHTYIQC